MIFHNKKLGRNHWQQWGPTCRKSDTEEHLLISLLSSSGTGKPAPGVKVTLGWQGAGRTGREHVMVSDVPGMLRVGCQKTRKFTELCLTICASFCYASIKTYITKTLRETGTHGTSLP